MIKFISAAAILAAALPVLAQEQTVLPHYVVVKEDPAYGERFDHTSVVHNDLLWVIGGQAERRWLNDVWSSPDGVEWTQTTSEAPWAPRGQHQSVSYNGRIYVFGGYNGELYNDVWSSEDGVEWREETTSAPWSARTDFRATVFNDKIYMMGGLEDWRRLNDVWSSSDGVSWELVTEHAPWHERSDFHLAIHNDRLIIMGGASFDYNSWLNEFTYGHYVYHRDVWATSNGSDWELLAESTPLGGRILGAMASLGDYIYFISGDVSIQGNGVLRDTWVSKDAITWNMLKEPPRDERNIRRSNHGHVVFANTIYIIGGVITRYSIYNYRPAVMRLEGSLQAPEPHFDLNPPPPRPQPGDADFQ